MGLLDQVIGSVLGAQQTGGVRNDGGAPMGGGLGGAFSGTGGGMSPLVMALMSLLASRSGGGLGGGMGGGPGGGLGGLLGGLAGGAGGRGSGLDSGGGLGSLIDMFQRSGHGEIMNSWVGSGENRAIAPHQLGDALGPDTVESLSQQTGLGRDDLLGQLSQVLPGVVNGMTPHGRTPTPEEEQGW